MMPSETPQPPAVLARAARPSGVSLCEMCQRERAYPPNPYCEACLTYMADCEAELGSAR